MCLEFKYWMTGGWDKLRVLLQRRNGQVIGVGEFKSKQHYSTINVKIRTKIRIKSVKYFTSK